LTDQTNVSKEVPDEQYDKRTEEEQREFRWEIFEMDKPPSEARLVVHEVRPIPFETKYPQSLRYTTLHESREATTTDDLL
jgi:hypothetical protein